MTNLNEGQRQAVTHFEGPMLVLAGPGSGKTRVITERIHHLIAERGVSPSEILVITFTKAAAAEMRQRYQKLYPRDSAGVRFGTFHAIFFMILKAAYHYTADNIVREEVRREILKDLIHGTDLEIQDENEFIGDLESEISRVKGDRMDLEHYYSPLCPGDTFREIFLKYQQALERRRLLDFDDMLVYCYELLSQRGDILQLWQEQFRYILIDEFQDISLVQYDVMKLLAAPENHIFIVGDDDQSIYGFRGAKPDIMKQFLKDFRGAKKCFLDINYRCAAPIVEAAGRVISQNKNRMAKKIRAAEEPAVAENGTIAMTGEVAATESNGFLAGDGLSEENWVARDSATGKVMISVQVFPRVAEENVDIREKILSYQREGIPLGEMAVLFRTNPQARALSSKLVEFNIPFSMKERIPNLYDHWMVQDVLAYVRVAQGNRERGQVMRIINKPKRYVHRNAFTEPYADLEELKRFYEDKEWMVDRIEQLQHDLSMLAKMKPYAAVNFIRRGIGYAEYVREYADYRGISPDDLLEILDELQEEAKSHESFEEWFASMQEYREELLRQSRKKEREQEDGVQLMTMHGAKGLEFACVFIPDANEGVTPHSKSVLTADLEEERRMFYVAMTRAKKHLHISYVKERFNKEVDISRFVQEIIGKN